MHAKNNFFDIRGPQNCNSLGDSSNGLWFKFILTFSVIYIKINIVYVLWSEILLIEYFKAKYYFDWCDILVKNITWLCHNISRITLSKPVYPHSELTSLHNLFCHKSAKKQFQVDTYIENESFENHLYWNIYKIFYELLSIIHYQVIINWIN